MNRFFRILLITLSFMLCFSMLFTCAVSAEDEVTYTITVVPEEDEEGESMTRSSPLTEIEDEDVPLASPDIAGNVQKSHMSIPVIAASAAVFIAATVVIWKLIERRKEKAFIKKLGIENYRR